MIIGAHSIVYSMNPEADRAFLRDVLKLPGVDVGGGWLIFGLPPAEVAVHPSHKNDVHEFYLMCDDVEAFIASMQRANIVCEPVQDQRWASSPRYGCPAADVWASISRDTGARGPRP